MQIVKARFLLDGKPVSKEYFFNAMKKVKKGEIAKIRSQNGYISVIVTAVRVTQEEHQNKIRGTILAV